MDEYPNTNVADVAAVVSADFRLAEGCDRLFHDKAIAEQQLSQAIESYGKELDQGGRPVAAAAGHVRPGAGLGGQGGPRCGHPPLPGSRRTSGPTGPSPPRPESGWTT